MAERRSGARGRSSSKRDTQQEADGGMDQNGHEQDVARYEEDLRAYLQDRIKPGLNAGNIPMLARSIARELAGREHPDDGLEPPDFEADMHELQAELGEDWIVHFSVQGDEAWMTAEKDDGSQRVEAPTGEVLAEVVRLLNERGGRSG